VALHISVRGQRSVGSRQATGRRELESSSIDLQRYRVGKLLGYLRGSKLPSGFSGIRTAFSKNRIRTRGGQRSVGEVVVGDLI
jgi:hypothetical protein